MPSATFFADAVLFDMDGTLTDSIAAVEAAWGKVASDLGLDPAFVIAATHGKRAIDNLAHFRPELKSHEMDNAVAMFEQSILDFADEFAIRKNMPSGKAVTTIAAGSARGTTPPLPTPAPTPLSLSDYSTSDPVSGYSTPSLMTSSSSASGRSSRSDSMSVAVPELRSESQARRPSFATRLSHRLACVETAISDDCSIEEAHSSDTTLLPYLDIDKVAELREDVETAWAIESDGVDRSIRILPGVKKMLDSIPEGRYAVATSGAKTYAYGAMSRVGITPPAVTITADDRRLAAGKPAPDPFLLAASCLGFSAHTCVVFEDSPSGIRAGVASGATVIAVCTSHSREKIENCGAHFIVENMDHVNCCVVGEGEGMKLQFMVEY